MEVCNFAQQKIETCSNDESLISGERTPPPPPPHSPLLHCTPFFFFLLLFKQCVHVSFAHFSFRILCLWQIALLLLSPVSFTCLGIWTKNKLNPLCELQLQVRFPSLQVLQGHGGRRCWVSSYLPALSHHFADSAFGLTQALHSLRENCHALLLSEFQVYLREKSPLLYIYAQWVQT